MDDEEKEEDEDSPPMCGKGKEVRIVGNRWTDKEKDKKVDERWRRTKWDG